MNGSTQCTIAHTFHFLGGLFGAFGLLSLAPRQAGADRLERVGFIVAVLGRVMFTGTGIITAFVWPIFEEHAPALTELVDWLVLAGKATGA